MLRIALLLLYICLYHNVTFAITGSSGSVLLDKPDDLVYSDKYKISFVDTTDSTIDQDLTGITTIITIINIITIIIIMNRYM